MKLQKVKMEMSRAIVNSENSTMYSMGTDRLLDLFTVDNKPDFKNKPNEDPTMMLQKVDDSWHDEEYAKLLF